MDKFEQMLWASALTRIRQADAKGRGGTDEMFQAVVDRHELLIQHDTLIEQVKRLREALESVLEYYSDDMRDGKSVATKILTHLNQVLRDTEAQK